MALTKIEIVNSIYEQIGIPNRHERRTRLVDAEIRHGVIALGEGEYLLESYS